MIKAKKVISGVLLFVVSQFDGKAQELRGFTTSPWSGVAQLSDNPASIAGHMYKWDFILAGASFSTDNDFLYWNKNNTRFQFNDDELSLSPHTNHTYFSHTQSIHGPAFMFSVNDRTALAIGMRSRAQVSVFNVSSSLSNVFAAYASESETTAAATNDQVSLSAAVWQEYFVTYATVISNAGLSRQKVGITPKLLIGNSQVQGDFSRIQFTQNGNQGTLNAATGSIHYSHNLDSIRPVNALLGTNGYGFAVDIGYEMEYGTNGRSCGFRSYARPTVCSGPTYLYKFGISLTDVGFLRFKNGQYATDLTYEDGEGVVFSDWISGIDNSAQASDSINAIANTESNTGAYYTSIPTQLRMDFDYHVYKSVYVSTQGQLSLSQVFRQNTTARPAELNVTPRVENNGFGVYAPLSINQYGNFDYGLGLRAGPVVLGVTDLNAVFSKQPVNDLGAYIMFKSYFRCKSKKGRSGKVICPSI